MIDSILLVDDEDLFQIVFEDACSILDITLSLNAVSSSDEAERMFANWHTTSGKKPECAFIDLNIIGSSFDGIELIRKVNKEYGNGVVIGIISSSEDHVEMEKAKAVGAMFWIVKSDNVEPRLQKFKQDFNDFKNGVKGFTVYR